MSKKSVKPYLALTIAGLSIPWASIFARLANAPSPVIALWRTVISSIILLISSITDSNGRCTLIRALNNTKDHVLIIVSGIMLALHLALWVESLFLLPVAISVIIVDTYPLISVIIDYKIFRTKPSSLQVIGITIAFTSIVLLTLSTGIEGIVHPLGLVFAFTASLCAAVYFSIGRHLRRNYPTTVYAGLVYGYASLTLLFYCISLGYKLTEYSITTWFYFLMFAIIPMLGGHTMINYALRYVKLSSAISIVLVEPIGASILAAIVLSELISPLNYLLLLFVVTGIYLALRRSIIEA